MVLLVIQRSEGRHVEKVLEPRVKRTVCLKKELRMNKVNTKKGPFVRTEFKLDREPIETP